MGGRGSGNFYRWNTRDTTDQYQRLDVRTIHRAGLLQPGYMGTVRWSRGERDTGSIGITAWGTGQRATMLQLRYTVRDEPVTDPIPVDWTPCHYGGARPWFTCPGCGRRVAILYGGRLFRCRHCHRLAYQTTREDAAGRHLRRTQAIRERLGGSANIYTRFPEKPKGMHWQTYERLRWEANEAEYDSWGALAARFRLLEE